MIPDIPTIIIFASIITIFMGIALAFYEVSQKTYPGFRFWIIGTFILAFGFQLILFRTFLPLWFSIISSSFAFMLGSIFKWESASRFFNDKKLKFYIYVTPFIFTGIIAYFYFVENNIVIRNLVLSTHLFVVSSLAFFEFINPKTTAASFLQKITGAVLALYGISIMSRAVFWYFNPSSTIFDAGMFHGVYFIAITIFDLGLGIFFMMINSQRVEEELNDSKNDLKDSVNRLEKALAEIKTLTGLLPICATCKKIRDDKGYWNQIENYIESHSQAMFSHGICPDCANRLYKKTKPQKQN